MYLWRPATSKFLFLFVIFNCRRRLTWSNSWERSSKASANHPQPPRHPPLPHPHHQASLQLAALQALWDPPAPWRPRPRPPSAWTPHPASAAWPPTMPRTMSHLRPSMRICERAGVADRKAGDSWGETARLFNRRPEGVVGVLLFSFSCSYV